MTGGNHRSNTELIAQGVANICFFHFRGYSRYRGYCPDSYKYQKWGQNACRRHYPCHDLTGHYALRRQMGRADPYGYTGRDINRGSLEYERS